VLITLNRLMERGVLDAAEDIFYFRKAELQEWIATYPNEQREVFRQKVYHAKRSYEDSRARTPPWTLDEEPTKTEVPSLSLRGLPGSPGRMTGQCFLVHRPEDFARFPKGAILVARTTNPA
jgi:rifampicin phosphotransferase